MLTRLKVDGFKNLVDVDIHFGPFTCIAGANGVGKSNLFDAIRFMSALSTKSLLDAALSVRDEGGHTGDLRSIFHRVGNRYADTITISAELIIPQEAVDDLGQKAKATISFVRYEVVVAYREDQSLPVQGSLVLLKEELSHIKLGDAAKHLRFRHSASHWRKSVVQGRRTSSFISTDQKDGEQVITLRQDGNSGRPKQFLAANLPRTVLSTVNATESPTALITRRELESWNLLQLEPSALREPDRFTTPPGLQPSGSHLPATLDYLYRQQSQTSNGRGKTWVLDQVARRLGELIDDVRQVRLDHDERRELISVEIMDREGTIHPARSLSDGTLRFLALSVLEMDGSTGGLICFEEPENGIHPARIPAMLELLQDIAVDVQEPVDQDNPLRQVIINTHSPSVVKQVPDDSLLVAELVEKIVDGQRFKSVEFNALPDTWRTETTGTPRPISRGKLLHYLNPILFENNGHTEPYQRVMDRPDIQQMVMPWGKSEGS